MHDQLDAGGQDGVTDLDLTGAVAEQTVEADQAVVGFAARATVVAIDADVIQCAKAEVTRVAVGGLPCTHGGYIAAHHSVFPPDSRVDTMRRESVEFFSMKKLTVESQIAILRAATKYSVARNLHHWMLGGAAALALFSAVIWHPIPLMIALFIGIVGASERRAVPNIQSAIRAYDTASASFGEVLISLTCWDTDAHYHAVVREHGRPDWAYEFMPQGWLPVAGAHAARIWRLDGCDAPALAATDNGILIPRYDPKKS